MSPSVKKKKGKKAGKAGAGSPGKASRKTKGSQEGKGPEKPGKRTGRERMEPLLSWVAGLSDEELMSALAETKKGIFGDPLKKLKKDITERLGVKEDEAFQRGTLLAYSRLEDVEKSLAEKHGERVKPKPAEKEKLPKKVRRERMMSKPSMAPPTAPGSKTAYRAERVEKLLREQKRLEEAGRKAEEKKPNVILRSFRAVGSGINSAASSVAHGVFVLFSTLVAIPIDLGRMIAKMLGGFMQAIYRRVGGLSPLGWKKKINMLVIYSGIDKTQEEVTGITIINGAALALAVGVLTYMLMGWELLWAAVASLLAFCIVWVIVYSIINLMADKRTDEVESALPDVLQIVSANISAGMTPYNALWVSARKEFGALAEEIKVAQKETLGGKPFTTSLTEMGQRVRSHVLQRTIRLLIQGMKAGGELPHILQGIGTDIRQMRLLQKEMAANTMSYLLFILFGMLLGAPLLFSVSIQFVGVINKFQPEMSMDPAEMAGSQPGTGMGGSSGFSTLSLASACPKDFDSDGLPDSWERDNELDPKNASDAWAIEPVTGKTYMEIYQETAEPLPPNCITPGYLSFFAVIALFSVSFFGSLLLGLIRSGKQSAGVKLMPVLIPATLGMFWLMSAGMSVFFNSLFGT